MHQYGSLVPLHEICIHNTLNCHWILKLRKCDQLHQAPLARGQAPFQLTAGASPEASLALWWRSNTTRAYSWIEALTLQRPCCLPGYCPKAPKLLAKICKDNIPSGCSRHHQRHHPSELLQISQIRVQRRQCDCEMMVFERCNCSVCVKC